ncbi:Lcl C-terminal domain-containing protein [Treponema sp. R6D11]
MKKIAIVSVFIFLTIIGCFSDWKGGEGTLTINLGGDSNGRAVEWPPYYDDGGTHFRYPMKYILTLDGPTGIIEKTFSFSEDDLIDNAKFTFFVATGRWNINIKAYITDKGNFLYSTGIGNVNVKVGNNSVGITMNKAYYDIGDDGPGGGKIFHVDPKGFNFYHDKDDTVGIIAYYLEVAPGVWLTDNGNNNFTWATTTTPPDAPPNISTSEKIGTGKKNTELILSIDPTAPAAKACIDYKGSGKGDWFLPSKDEISVLLENKDSIGFKPSNSYWSSSQQDVYNAYCLYVSSCDSPPESIGSYGKTYYCSVRPIRAF